VDHKKTTRETVEWTEISQNSVLSMVRMILDVS